MGQLQSKHPDTGTKLTCRLVDESQSPETDSHIHNLQSVPVERTVFWRCENWIFMYGSMRQDPYLACHTIINSRSRIVFNQGT